jgi:hypothetical protein
VEGGEESAGDDIPDADAGFGVLAVGSCGRKRAAVRVESDAVDALPLRAVKYGSELVGCGIPQVDAAVGVSGG